MSNTDSFIEEVSEEVRKDRLFAKMRKYAWVAVVFVLLLVGGTGYREFSIAADKKRAQETGDAILAALELESNVDKAKALGEIQTLDDAGLAIVLLLQASALSSAPGNSNGAEIIESLENSRFSSPYLELANFKKLLLEGSGLSAAARFSELEAIARSSSPYRLFAEEQLALINLASGDQEAAIKRLSEIFDDASASSNLRQRVSQMLVILGKTPTTLER